jgi:hypothetical protein
MRPYPQFCNALYNNAENAGRSKYHSFQFKAERRMSRGLWFLGSYTWSKFMSTGTDLQSEMYQGIFNPYQRERFMSLDRQDTPQAMSFALMYALPFGRGQRFLSRSGTGGSLLDKAVGGWQLLSVFRASSGLPFTFYANCSVPGAFAAACLPGVVSGANVFSQSKGSFDPNRRLFNVAAFEGGSAGGNLGFNLGQGARVTNIRGFGYHGHDVTFVKSFGITERVRFELKAEFFNIWNWHIFTQGTTWGQGGAFVTDISDPSFGLITRNVTTPRNIQLGAKLSF